MFRSLSWILRIGRISFRRALTHLFGPTLVHLSLSDFFNRPYRVRQFSEALEVELLDEIRQRQLSTVPDDDWRAFRICQGSFRARVPSGYACARGSSGVVHRSTVLDGS